MDVIQIRRGTAAQWVAANPVLRPGEPGLELDTGNIKVGNGFDIWTELPPFLNLTNLMSLIEDISAEGIAGDSAYEVAVNNGFVGTEAEWLASLQGEDGADGAPGTPGTPGADGEDGAPGSPGAAGDSAYQVALDNGFVGTEAAWLLSLKGATGDPGTPGTDGDDGAPGAPGDSAYQVAVDNGFVGSEAAWLASLEGPSGSDGADGADGVDYTGPTITVASSAPSSPAVNDIWIDLSA